MLSAPNGKKWRVRIFVACGIIVLAMFVNKREVGELSAAAALEAASEDHERQSSAHLVPEATGGNTFEMDLDKDATSEEKQDRGELLAAAAVAAAGSEESKGGGNTAAASVRVKAPPTTTVSKPILVVGMSKCGTSSIAVYFKCAGLKVSHLMCDKKSDHNKRVRCATIIRENIDATRPVFHGMDYDVYTHMEAINPKKTCFLPQVDALDEIHNSYPNATFILNLRDVNHWVRSVNGWHSRSSRWKRCFGKTNFTDYYITHTERIRDFVRRHPTHTLVEIDIESPRTGEVMEKAFGTTRKCWGHANMNKNLQRDDE